VRVYIKLLLGGTRMEIKIKVDGKKYGQCEKCGVYHKTSKGKKNQKKVVCTKQ
jgi:hypothetical protein